MKKKKIIICGAFGIGSIGDEVGLDMLVSSVKDFAAVSVFMRNPSEAYEKAHSVTAFPKLEHTTRKEAEGRIFRGLNYNDDPSIISGMIRIISQHDLLLLGPGDFVNEDCPGFLRGALPEMVFMAWLSQMAGVPYMIYAASARKLGSAYAKYQLEWLLKNSSSTTIRDTRSIHSIGDCTSKKNPMILTPDPVRCLKPTNNPTKEGLLVSVRNLFYKGFQTRMNYIQTIRKVISLAKRKGPFSVGFISMFTNTAMKDDFDESLLCDTEYSMNIFSSDNFQSTINHINTFSRALVTRLHAAVMCYTCGVPFVAISYEDKVRGFFEEVGATYVTLDTPPEEVYSLLMNAKPLPVEEVTMDPYVKEIKRIFKMEV